ncbi:type VI secretion system protein TssA [Massilia eurypsychrophila]|uniref:Type VI secretion system protein TssA n=1 Tax=Massilia eurypsychrophila TaxID=1485217 RepID=A0A2G8TFZ8_9BURK|nr:type VI secretion system protein TssA [Massilia eurypsychrophila]PIL44981.1 type VI secretion system protein TssA [Massilia eurypsychrophila]
MSKVDVDAVLREVDATAPCGPNLEYDPVFVELEQAVQGKPEVQYGDTISAATQPDWKAVDRLASGLLERSRDLRLVLHLMRAQVALHGLDGLADGMRMLERLLDERWDSVHPQLDADDGMDPTLRINSLAVLTDRTSLLRELREASLLVLPGLGPLSMRRLDIAQGDLAAADGEQKLAVASIELALADLVPGALAAAVDKLQRALDSVVNIETLLVRQVGSSQALNLDELTRPLRRGRDFLASRLAPAAAVAAVGVADTAAAPSGPAAPARISGDIASRDDVVRTLDKLIAYYRQHEPSSPLPILLERARRLVPKSFLEIIADIAPDGMSQLMVFKGADGSNEEGS